MEENDISLGERRKLLLLWPWSFFLARRRRFLLVGLMKNNLPHHLVKAAEREEGKQEGGKRRVGNRSHSKDVPPNRSGK